jgi:hypothetical protein
MPHSNQYEEEIWQAIGGTEGKSWLVEMYFIYQAKGNLVKQTNRWENEHAPTHPATPGLVQLGQYVSQSNSINTRAWN